MWTRFHPRVQSIPRTTTFRPDVVGSRYTVSDSPTSPFDLFSLHHRRRTVSQIGVFVHVVLCDNLGLTSLLPQVCHCVGSCLGFPPRFFSCVLSLDRVFQLQILHTFPVGIPLTPTLPRVSLFSRRYVHPSKRVPRSRVFPSFLLIRPFSPVVSVP